MKVLADADARQRIVGDFGGTFVVEAAAGTGKTTEMVGRIVALIRSGVGTLGRTVAVTFTDKAAGEMKLRLRIEIERARRDGTIEERRRLEKALEELELARVGTIHSFCGDILRERPVEARIDPLFELAPDDEMEALADEAFDRWFERVLSDPPEGIRRILRRQGENGRRRLLRNAMWQLCEHRDFPEPWKRDAFDRNGTIDALMAELAEVGRLAAKSSRPNDRLARNLTEIARFVGDTTRLEGVRSRDYDGLESELRELAKNRRRFQGWHWVGSPNTRFAPLDRDAVLARRDQVRSRLHAFIAASDADLAPLLHEALQAAVAEYEAVKARAGRLDYLDLLIKTRNLLRDDAVARQQLQNRFSHFFVDEFQDTDPLQVEILLLLTAADPTQTDWRLTRPVSGKLFVVGDPKQSIYRFRRADISIYEDVKRHLLASGATLLHLTTSFRAVRSIQRFVNGTFSTPMKADNSHSQPDYVPLGKWRADCVSKPTIIALPVPSPYSEYGRVTARQINESYPECVAAFVSWLVEDSGWSVEEQGKLVAIRPRHIAILFRRFRNFNDDVTRPYVRGMEARRVPHVLVGGRSFHDREEVIALRNVIAAIEWPDDELRVFATLRGPFLGLSDEALLDFRHQLDGEGSQKTRRLNPTSPIDRSTLNPAAMGVADALELLRELHLSRNHRPIAHTITRFLEAVRATRRNGSVAKWRTGISQLPTTC